MWETSPFALGSNPSDPAAARQPIEKEGSRETRALQFATVDGSLTILNTGARTISKRQIVNTGKCVDQIMKWTVFLAIALFLFATMPILVRCEETIINDQFTFDESNANSLNVHAVSLKSNDTISIRLVVSQGTIGFKIEDTMVRTLLNKENVGTGGWQGQWTVPYDDIFNFELYLERDAASAAAGTITVTNSTSQGGGGGGGFDPLPIVVAVIALIVWFVSVFLIVRIRKQLPPPPEQPPPPSPS